MLDVGKGDKSENRKGVLFKVVFRNALPWYLTCLSRLTSNNKLCRDDLILGVNTCTLCVPITGNAFNITRVGVLSSTSIF